MCVAATSESAEERCEAWKARSNTGGDGNGSYTLTQPSKLIINTCSEYSKSDSPS